MYTMNSYPYNAGNKLTKVRLGVSTFYTNNRQWEGGSKAHYEIRRTLIYRATF